MTLDHSKNRKNQKKSTTFAPYTIMTTRIILVEDDPWFGALLKRHLSLNPDYEVHLFTSGRDCLRNLHLKPDIVTIDFGLPDMQGDQLLSELLQYNKQLPVIV